MIQFTQEQINQLDKYFYEPRNLVDLFEGSVVKWADRPSIGQKDPNTRKYVFLTYRQLAERINNLRGALKKLGLQKGETVGVILSNSIEWFVLENATHGLGGRFIGVERLVLVPRAVPVPVPQRQVRERQVPRVEGAGAGEEEVPFRRRVSQDGVGPAAAHGRVVNQAVGPRFERLGAREVHDAGPLPLGLPDAHPAERPQGGIPDPAGARLGFFEILARQRAARGHVQRRVGAGRIADTPRGQLQERGFGFRGLAGSLIQPHRLLEIRGKRTGARATRAGEPERCHKQGQTVHEGVLLPRRRHRACRLAIISKASLNAVPVGESW